ncbi:MAG TPA: pentapeptide repeat-containing protein, partial [Flavobacteriales bacterium]|nr:pentapeptide repeat-containing protein [Flavobacteriales bacterium]
MDRWKKGIGKEFADHLLKWGRSGNGLVISESPFGMTEDGLLDFRGLQFGQRVELLRVEFKAADFSKAQFKDARIGLSTFTDSLWEKSDFRGLVESGSKYIRCRFTNCAINGSFIGYKGTHFDTCFFKGCNFKRTSFIRPEFDDCIFDNNNFNGCDFFGSSFERCEFNGVLKDVRLRGGFPLPDFESKYGKSRPNKMLNVSFKNADLIEMTYSDRCDLSTVTVPIVGDYALLEHWPERLLRLEQIAESWPPQEQK